MAAKAAMICPGALALKLGMKPLAVLGREALDAITGDIILAADKDTLHVARQFYYWPLIPDDATDPYQTNTGG